MLCCTCVCVRHGVPTASPVLNVFSSSPGHHAAPVVSSGRAVRTGCLTAAAEQVPQPVRVSTTDAHVLTARRYTSQINAHKTITRLRNKFALHSVKLIFAH